MEMDYSQVVALLPNEQQSYLPDFSELEQEQTKGLVSTALSTLTNREREVIRMRFEDELTYDECAKRFDVTRERIRQIESKAMRKLRHPARIGMFVDALDVDEQERAKYKRATAEYLEKVGAGGTAHNVEAQGRQAAASSPAGVPLERRVGPHGGKNV